jgi:hypothetical protein
VAAIDDPSRIRHSRDVGAYLGLVPRRYQSGEVDYVGSISKCGDRRVRTLPYEAANVMLTRYKGQLKLKDWAFAIAKRSTIAKRASLLARRLAIIMHAMLRDGVRAGLGPSTHQTGGRHQLPRGATPEGGSRRRRGFCCMGPTVGQLRFQPSRPAPSLPHQVPNEHAENAGIPRRRQRRRASPLTH